MKSQKHNNNLAIMILVFMITPLMAISFFKAQNSYVPTKSPKKYEEMTKPYIEGYLEKGGIWKNQKGITYSLIFRRIIQKNKNKVGERIGRRNYNRFKN